MEPFLKVLYNVSECIQMYYNLNRSLIANFDAYI